MTAYEKLAALECRECRVAGRASGTQCRRPQNRGDQAALASSHSPDTGRRRLGERPFEGLANPADFAAGGLKVAKKQPTRGRMWPPGPLLYAARPN